MLLNACFDAGITWLSKRKATEYAPDISLPIFIGKKYRFGNQHIGHGCQETFSGCENITDWFFNEITK